MSLHHGDVSVSNPLTTEIEVLHLGIASKGGDFVPHKLVDLIATLQGELDSVPAEFIESAEYSFEPDYEYGDSYDALRVTYTRPETSAEREARVARELAELAKRDAEHAAWSARRGADLLGELAAA
mgnify:CR=1 FL=1|jgi:hypothetical protein